MSLEQDIADVARIRKDAHKGGVNPIDAEGCDGDTCNLYGVTAEAYFARCFSLPMDRRALPEGDGGRDFVVSYPNGTLTIDVKGAVYPSYLFIREDKIGRCADILVLVALDGPKQEKNKPPVVRTPRLVGWETRDMMLPMPVADFGFGRNYYRAAAELRPISQLVNFLAARTGPWA